VPDVSGERVEEPRRRGLFVPVAQRAGAWAGWWALLMAFWIILDYSIRLDELLAGAGAAALGATLAELSLSQAGIRFRVRPRWLLQALRLPGEVVRDTVIVFGALARRVARGEEPASGFRELPIRFGDDSPEGVSRRVLMVGAGSLAPNTFVLGIDRERQAMIVHQLVVNQGREAK
jgi:multisubunit Na+/H+ antiporter MnhE subunit